MKTILIVLIGLITISTSWACRCNPEALQRIFKNPKSAELAFVATAKVSEKKQILIVNKAWTKTDESYEVDSQTSCRLFLKDGEEYLILSTQKNNLHQCSAHFIPIAAASDLVEVLEAKSRVSADE